MFKEFEAKKKKNRPPIKLHLPSLASAQTNSNKKKLTCSLTHSYQNVRGLCTKLSTLYLNSLYFSSQIVVFTETWLKPEILNSKVLPNKYTTYRCDQPDRRGGGVLIAVTY